MWSDFKGRGYENRIHSLDQDRAKPIGLKASELNNGKHSSYWLDPLSCAQGHRRQEAEQGSGTPQVTLQLMVWQPVQDA